MHLIIPFAARPAAASPKSPARPQPRHLEPLPELPQLQRLLQRLAPATQPDADASADAYTRSPPHERVLAAALGLQAPDGQIPWAALQAQRSGFVEGFAGLAGASGKSAWAFVTPCHWHVGMDHISMSGLAGLGLQEAESRALLASLQPWFAEDGIALHYLQPGQWLACAEVFRGLATASLDRVQGRNLDAWMPEGVQAAPLRRLQNEMQMLLYHHPVNDARAARGLLPINSFWLSGAGALPVGDSVADNANSAHADMQVQAQVQAQVQVVDSLREPALAQDWAAWAAAWQAIDATHCSNVLRALDAGQAVQLSLCGEHSAHSWGPAKRPFLSRITMQIRQKSAWNMREQL